MAGLAVEVVDDAPVDCAAYVQSLTTIARDHPDPKTLDADALARSFGADATETCGTAAAFFDALGT